MGKGAVANTGAAGAEIPGGGFGEAGAADVGAAGTWAAGVSAAGNGAAGTADDRTADDKVAGAGAVYGGEVGTSVAEELGAGGGGVRVGSGVGGGCPSGRRRVGEDGRGGTAGPGEGDREAIIPRTGVGRGEANPRGGARETPGAPVREKSCTESSLVKKLSSWEADVGRC